MRNYLLITILFSIITCGTRAQTYYSEAVVTSDAELIREAKSYFDETTKQARKKYDAKVFQLYYEKSLYRIRAFRDMLENGELLYSGKLYDEVNQLFEQIKTSNPELDSNLRMFIYRAEDANAFSTGDNMIFLNLGLLSRCKSREQLAFIIAHEIAHNELAHFETKIVKYAEVYQSKELKEELKRVKRSKYNKLSSYYELMLPHLLTERSQSRSDEVQADSLGFVYFKNANFELEKALGVFSVMDSFDDEPWDSLLVKSNYFGVDVTNDVTERLLKKNAPSPFGIFTQDTITEVETEMNLSTHPYPMDRLKIVLNWNDIDSNTIQSNVQDDYTGIIEMSSHELVSYFLRSEQIDKALYYSLRNLEGDPNNEFYQRAVSYALQVLIYAKNNLSFNRFVSIENDYEGDFYNDFLKFLWECKTVDFKEMNNHWFSLFPETLESNKWGVSIAFNALYDKDYQGFEKGLELQKGLSNQDPLFYALLKDFSSKDD